MNETKMMAYDELSSKFQNELRDLEDDIAHRIQKVEILKEQVSLLENVARKPHTNYAAFMVLENELEVAREHLKDERDALEEVSRSLSPRMVALKEIVEAADVERQAIILVEEQAATLVNE